MGHISAVDSIVTLTISHAGKAGPTGCNMHWMIELQSRMKNSNTLIAAVQLKRALGRGCFSSPLLYRAVDMEVTNEKFYGDTCKPKASCGIYQDEVVSHQLFYRVSFILGDLPEFILSLILLIKGPSSVIPVVILSLVGIKTFHKLIDFGIFCTKHTGQ
jgi:hypothetical protein